MIKELVIPVSQEQEDVLADHILLGTELGLLPDERAWMMSHAQKAHPGCKIVSADLNIEEAEWTLTLETA